MAKPLDGIRVLDFSRVLAGPFCTTALAEMGADVVKVERPDGGDEARRWEPFVGGEVDPEKSAYFFTFNRQKRSMTLNLKSEEGLDVARRMAREADVVIENLMPGGMAKYALSYDDLKTDNPGLVYLSNTGFGQTGPYSKRKGYDTIFQAMGGVMSLTGEYGGGPVKVGTPIADLTAGLWGLIGILSGLAGRQNSGHGCYVDLSMYDVQVSLLSMAAATYFTSGDVLPRSGTERLGRVPTAGFECRNGRWLQISASDQHWEALCRVLGLDDLWADEDLRDNNVRVKRRAEVYDALRPAILAWGRDELLDAFDKAGVPCGPINHVDEIMDDPHTRARDLVQTFVHPVIGEFPALRQPLRYRDYDNPDVGRPPLLGEHTEAVLQEWLGLDGAAVAALREKGAV
ncbi:MAG: CaiB/BaiF CoA-transferase family protein [Acetobacterales bacterium]